MALVKSSWSRHGRRLRCLGPWRAFWHRQNFSKGISV